MGDPDEKAQADPPKITSRDHEELLNTIDRIRAQGISRYIDIPQIVVCGDQSSGKSSCLEAICGLRFEVGDGLCTRFPTEYVLRRSDVVSTAIGINPDPERPDTEKDKLSVFKPSTTDLIQFPTIMKEVSAAMGIGHGRTFAHDRLRIEVSGPSQPHLTLVDVPGLFHSSSSGQSETDKEAVFSLVTSYVKNPRSIIMAVVSAKNDPQNQIVLDFAQKHDPKGQRTIGIVTKPDTLSKNSPSENHYYALAQNQDVYFTLGWAVMRNRSFEERASSTAERDAIEMDFLEQGIWKGLNFKNKGVASLRLRLGEILHNHILSSLPSLLNDVRTGIQDCRLRLDTLGSSRGTHAEQRLYLLRASQKFVDLISAAVSGTYEDGFFTSAKGPLGFQKRLRAVTMSVLKDFATTMRLCGHAVELRENISSSYQPEKNKRLLKRKSTFYIEVQQRIAQNQGCELPGFPSGAIISELFFEQSAPWMGHIQQTKDNLVEAAHTAIGHVLNEVADDATVGVIRRFVINQNMVPIEKGLDTKVDEIMAPHLRGHAITFNHYFTDTLEKLRQESNRAHLLVTLRNYFDIEASQMTFTGLVNIRNLADRIVTKGIEPDSDRYGAIQATNGMLAYYKTQLKSVIDNFAMYAIEVCLLKKLPGVFTPEIVLGLDDQTVAKIAGESPESVAERQSLNRKLIVLQETQKILHLMDRHKLKVNVDPVSVPACAIEVQVGTKRVVEDPESTEHEEGELVHQEDSAKAKKKREKKVDRKAEKPFLFGSGNTNGFGFGQVATPGFSSEGPAFGGFRSGSKSTSSD